MNRIVVAAALAATLAACTSASAPATGAAFAEPTALAVFRGVTTKFGLDPASLVTGSTVYPYRPYIAIANAASNDLTLLDGIDDSLLPAPLPLRTLVYPVPGRPLLLVAADLGDRKPDLLVVVTAGDLPALGGSTLEVIRTWAPDGAVVGSVDLGADVLALATLPFDPASPGTVQLVAALAGEKIAVVTFRRSTAGDGTAVDVAGAQVVTSGPLAFQPVDLAVVPGDRSRVFAASHDPLPDGVLGVAEISLVGTPAFVPPGLNALAPTRLVAAARLAEADLLRDLGSPVATAVDASAFVDASTSTARPTVDRVYAVLDESGCGVRAPIACGLVALDPVSRGLLLDPTPAGTTHAPYLAPLPVGAALALAAAGPPAVPPSAPEPQFAGTYMRIATTIAWRQTTAAAGVATTDGKLTFVDLARWDLPSEQLVAPNTGAKVVSSRPTGTTGTQWLVLQGTGGPVSHVEVASLAAAVTVTPGFTPDDSWVVVREGVLPGLFGLRAEAGNDGATPWLALQQTAADGSVHGAVHLWDPTLGVSVADTVVIEPTGLGTCTTFEATVSELVAPDARRPGGFVRLGHRTFSPGTPTVPAATLAAWDRCVDELAALPSSPPSGQPPFLAATFRAGGYVLLRGTGASAIHVGRPEVGARFDVAWQDETPLAGAFLQRVRLARRVGYVIDAPTLTGPALAFTLALEAPTAAVPRDLVLTIDTLAGRVPFRVAATAGFPVDPRSVVPFDRSPFAAAQGVRFLVPYAGGVVLDATPTLPGGGVNTVH